MTSHSERRDDPLAPVRRVVREALVEHCAAEHLSVPDFERRMRGVDVAISGKALLALLSDLPGRSRGGTTP